MCLQSSFMDVQCKIFIISSILLKINVKYVITIILKIDYIILFESFVINITLFLLLYRNHCYDWYFNPGPLFGEYFNTWDSQKVDYHHTCPYDNPRDSTWQWIDIYHRTRFRHHRGHTRRAKYKEHNICQKEKMEIPEFLMRLCWKLLKLKNSQLILGKTKCHRPLEKSSFLVNSYLFHNESPSLH